MACLSWWEPPQHPLKAEAEEGAVVEAEAAVRASSSAQAVEALILGPAAALVKAVTLDLAVARAGDAVG